MKFFVTKTVLTALLLSAVPSAMAAASAFPTGVTGKAVSDDQIVYMKYDGDWDIYSYDLNTGEERKITDAPGTQGYPAVSGRHIAWQDNRENPDAKLSEYDIYLYDQITGREQKISQHAGYNQGVKIAGDRVVWLDNSAGKSAVYVYDIATGVEKKITGDQANAFGVQISGDNLVWMDARNGDMDIYGYNFQTSQESRITSQPSKQADPKISGDLIIWHDYRDGVRQIRQFDLTSGAEKPLTSGSVPHTALGIDGGNILYREEGGANRLMLYDGKKGQALQLLGIGSDSDAVFLHEGKVFWRQGSQLQSAVVDQLTLPTAPTTAPAAPAEWMTVSAAGGTIFSPDKRVSLIIPPNELPGDVSLHITQTQEPQGQAKRPTAYQAVTDSYTVEVKDDVKVKGNFQLQFHDISTWSASWDPRRFVVQRLDQSQAKWINVRSSIPFDGKVSVSGEQLGTFVLAYYNSPFHDTEGHWGRGFIDTLAAQGIVNGYEDMTFRPDQSVTRAEFIALLANAFDLSSLPQTTPPPLSDIEGHWAKPYILAATQKGVAFGAEGKFRPDDQITRQEMVSMLVRAVQQTLPNQTSSADALAKFADEQDVSAWAKPYLQQVVSLGVVQGADGRISPLANTTRAEAVTVLYRMIEQRQKRGDAQ